jgi:hypothetical protein
VRAIAGIVCLALMAGSCAEGLRQPVNPPRLIMDSQADMSIQLFMQATILLANAYGYPTIQYAEIRRRSANAGFNVLPFMPPETIRATPELVNFFNQYENDGATAHYLVSKYGYKPLLIYYVRTGLRASQLICRSYLINLDERSQYLEFLRRELGVAYGLASGILALVNANGTLANAFLVSRSAVDGATQAFEDYRFLNIDRDAARVVVETAQNKYAQYFIDRIDKAANGYDPISTGYSLSDALNMISIIEYQCTREGIRYLLNRSINNTPSNLAIDETGNIMFHTTSVTPPATPLNADVRQPPVASIRPPPSPTDHQAQATSPRSGSEKPAGAAETLTLQQAFTQAQTDINSNKQKLAIIQDNLTKIPEGAGRQDLMAEIKRLQNDIERLEQLKSDLNKQAGGMLKAPVAPPSLETGLGLVDISTLQRAFTQAHADIAANRHKLTILQDNLTKIPEGPGRDDLMSEMNRLQDDIVRLEQLKSDLNRQAAGKLKAPPSLPSPDKGSGPPDIPSLQRAFDNAKAGIAADQQKLTVLQDHLTTIPAGSGRDDLLAEIARLQDDVARLEQLKSDLNTQASGKLK